MRIKQKIKLNRFKETDQAYYPKNGPESCIRSFERYLHLTEPCRNAYEGVINLQSLRRFLVIVR